LAGLFFGFFLLNYFAGFFFAGMRLLGGLSCQTANPYTLAFAVATAKPANVEMHAAADWSAMKQGDEDLKAAHTPSGIEL
jgi:hypothetical protein